MDQKIKIILVEDHPEYREVIELALEEVGDMELVHQFGSAERALSHLQDLPSVDQPGILLLDLNLPGMSGLEAIPWIKKYAPETKVIVLSQSNKEADVVQSIQFGASGYLLKSARIDQLVEGIRSVANGGASLDPAIASFILAGLRASAPAAAQQTLSDREFEVLSLLADGLVKKQIANQLEISVNTVVKHIVHIYEKLGVQNAPAAISQAYKSGIFQAGK
jgi:DNA-binding NarL/FixJ family response regulator